MADQAVEHNLVEDALQSHEESPSSEEDNDWEKVNPDSLDQQMDRPKGRLYPEFSEPQEEELGLVLEIAALLEEQSGCLATHHKFWRHPGWGQVGSASMRLARTCR